MESTDQVNRDWTVRPAVTGIGSITARRDEKTLPFNTCSRIMPILTFQFVHVIEQKIDSLRILHVAFGWAI